MGKKASASVFIIIALVLLILISFFYFIKNNQGINVLQSEADRVKSFTQAKERVEKYVSDCISLKTIEVFDKFWVTESSDIKLYLDKHFLECIDDFSGFREEGYDFEYSGYTHELELEGNDAIINMNFTVNISREGQRAQVKEFMSVIDLGSLNLETKGKYVVNLGNMTDFEILYKNVLYKVEEVNGLKLYIIKLNLNDPTIEFFVTPRQDYLEGTTSFLAKNKLQLAVNGGGWPEVGFTSNAQTELVTYSQGNLIAEGPDFWVTVTITKNNSVILGKKPKNPEDLYNVVTGFNLFVLNEEVTSRMYPGGPGYKEGYDTLDPRTTIGYDEENNVLNIILVDSGVVGQRMGMRLRDIGVYHVREGSNTAINMDGGGSTTLVIEGKGIVNAPSDGAERPVATHLGIWAEKVDFGEEIVS